MARFPSLTHLSLGDETPCSPDSLLALSKLQSLCIDARWQQGAAHLIGHLPQLPALRRLTVPCSSSYRSCLETEAWHQVCRLDGFGFLSTCGCCIVLQGN